MSEKRYYIGNGENCTICDSSKGGSDFFNMLTQYQAVDELNALHEENIQLKLQVRMLEQIKPIKEIPRSMEVCFRCDDDGKGN